MFAIISDLHLKENDRLFFKEKREELIKNTISDFISNDKITDVIFNGDTFNESKISSSWHVVNFFKNEVLIPLLNANKKIHILVWNHERTLDKNIFTFLKWEISNSNIFVYDTIEVQEFANFNAIFIPFLYPWDFNVSTISKLEIEAFKYIENKVNELKEKDKNKKVIIFNHNMMTKWLPFDNWRESNLDLMSIKNADFVFWGHIHKHEVFEKGMYVWSFMKSFVYEEESEWYIVWDIQDSINFEYIDNQSYNYMKLSIENHKEFDFNIIKENHVYDLEIYFDIWTQDSFFVSDLIKIISNNNSYIKTQKILTNKIDDNFLWITSIITTEEDILKDYLKENKVEKKDYNSYLNKLDICKSMLKNSSNLIIDKKTEEKEKENVKKVNNLSNIIRVDRRL